MSLVVKLILDGYFDINGFLTKVDVDKRALEC